MRLSDRRISPKHSSPSGARTERAAVCSAEAPGGVLWEASADYSAEGRRTFWSVTELVESGRSPIERVDAAEAPASPEISIEIHPRRLMRLLRREEQPPEPPMQ